MPYRGTRAFMKMVLWGIAAAVLAASQTACAPRGTAAGEDTLRATLKTFTTPTAAPSPQPAWWHPQPGLDWQWQLGGDEVDISVRADVFDLDLFDTPAETVATLHSRGAKLVCYMSAGSHEEWRSDADAFPAEVLGREYAGWPGERWLDIRRIDLLAPLLRARMDLCRQKGFDAVEPDNLDGYQNDTGFRITAADQLRFNRWLAEEAHMRGLAIGLKNDPDQAGALVADFDFALAEDCYDQGWCEQLRPFAEAGKPVLAVEYTDTGATTAGFCPSMRRWGFTGLLKHRHLDAWRETCPQNG